MNYLNHYNILINRALSRSIDGYYEQHHIIPKCIGGSDDLTNLANLTPEEHYTAHLLLTKIYPNVPGLIYACVKMTGNLYERKNKMYGWLKRKHAINTSIRMKGNTHNCGRILSEAHKEKISISAKGKIRTNDHCEKLSISNTGKILSKETKEKISKSKTGKLTSIETRAKQSIAHTGYKHTTESKQKMSEKQKGIPKSKPAWNKGLTKADNPNLKGKTIANPPESFKKGWETRRNNQLIRNNVNGF